MRLVFNSHNCYVYSMESFRLLICHKWNTQGLILVPTQFQYLQKLFAWWNWKHPHQVCWWHWTEGRGWHVRESWTVWKSRLARTVWTLTETSAKPCMSVRISKRPWYRLGFVRLGNSPAERTWGYCTGQAAYESAVHCCSKEGKKVPELHPVRHYEHR